MESSNNKVSEQSENNVIQEQLKEAKENKDWDKIIYLINSCIDEESNNLTLYLELCIAYRESKDFKKALSTLQLAEKKGFRSVWIHDNYARIYFVNKDYPNAIRECLYAVIESDESNRSLFTELLSIIKQQLDRDHLGNKYLSVFAFEVDRLVAKVLVDNMSPEDIELEIERKISPKQYQEKISALADNSELQADHAVRLIAYYLPQFHPIIENDEWWGAGFTEWVNVAQATPRFSGHYQPHVPGELGYYDLRLPEVRIAQAKLAKEHGIHGFCYYYYWFQGRKLLERPLQEVFESGEPDFPFCICWANENWSRRWDGSEDEILVQQVHNEQTDEDFIHDVLPLFKDPRYIKVNGTPLLIIYRLNLMPDPLATAKKWRAICAANGIPEIHLCMAETFGQTDPYQYGFNSAVQFPPHNMLSGLFPQDNQAPEKTTDTIAGLVENFTGDIYDYECVVKDQIAKVIPDYKQFPGVMTAWDNSARKNNAAMLFNNATPEAYETWLRAAIDRARDSLPVGEQLVFINAWNEWAEGAHLEPDRKNARSYLEATRRALLGTSDWRLLMEYAEQLPELVGTTKQTFLADLRYTLDRLSKVNEKLMGTRQVLHDHSIIRSGMPASWAELEHVSAGECHLERLNHYDIIEGQQIPIDAMQKLSISGWAYHDARQLLRIDTPTYIVFQATISAHTFFAPLHSRDERLEIAATHANPNIRYAGIKTILDISALAPACYHLSIASRWQNTVIITRFNVELEIV